MIIAETCPNSPCVENTTLVPSPIRTEHSTTLTPAVMPTIPELLAKQQVHSLTKNLLLAEWRKGTSNSYFSAWRKWASWSCKQKINPVCADIASVLEFLTFEFNSEKAYQTLNVYRSAISIHVLYYHSI